MSSIVRAFLLRQLTDIECIEEALKALGKECTHTENQIIINQNLRLDLTAWGAKLNYRTEMYTTGFEINHFIEDLMKEYSKRLEEKIERLKLEEARIKEKVAFDQFSEEERRQKENGLRKERMRLEAIKRKEEAYLKKQIEQKVVAIREKAAQLGYQIKEELKGKERVIVLVQR